MITLLDQDTINKIAAGEVIERPGAVVKELIENALDAGANAVTVEIKEGGIRFIRITDNGAGIPNDQIPLAFKRHATSKIRTAQDLLTVKSLGFRGEALSSIASVSQVELVTKSQRALTGSRYVIEGGEEKQFEEIGCPEGTTFIIRNLFYNTPARRKFLKSPMTEAGYVSELVERLAISHPETAFKFINNNQVKLQTSGNHNLKDIIYHIYGREIASNILPVKAETAGVSIGGYIGKPLISRGNRNYMNYFINGRYIRSAIINHAIEEACKPYHMQRRYPFAALCFTIEPALIDVNVHPAKMEIRFSNQEEIYHIIYEAVSDALKEKELIPEVGIEDEDRTRLKNKGKLKDDIAPEDSTKSKDPMKAWNKSSSIFLSPPEKKGPEPFEKNRITDSKREEMLRETFEYQVERPSFADARDKNGKAPEQMELFEDPADRKEGFLIQENIKEHRIIGQLFRTYWLIEYKDKLFIIDQHAAHEKVLFEKMMASIKNREFASQLINPPIVLTLNMREEEVWKQNREIFEKLGFEIEPFGGKEYSVRAVPANLLPIAQKELLLELIDGLMEEEGKQNSGLLLEKAASMSCKAAVKGNWKLSETEARQLIDELLLLENPYHCPHGRPTIISMSKHEMEKKFKRIV